MKLIKPEVEFLGRVPTGYKDALKLIEKAGRTCYKSEKKITEKSAETFVQKLVDRTHLAMVEHSNFVVRTVEKYRVQDTLKVANCSLINAGKYLNVACDRGTNERRVYVGGNLTAWAQMCKDFTWHMAEFAPFAEVYKDLFNLPDILGELPDSKLEGIKWEICPDDEIPEELQRYAIKFVCDRGVSHELVRHRQCSFAQESTRYVNYGGSDMQFVEPTGYDSWERFTQKTFTSSCSISEMAYNSMLTSGMSPQQARTVLPNALKTEIIVTADVAEWKHIRKLRTAAGAHPDMQLIMGLVPWESFLGEKK